jgi:AcrR family transcriptional regulator
MGTKERKIREKQARKKEILTAARTLLLEKGINGTSINRIARQAELGIGTIYFYYRSKEELFVELQTEGLALLNKRIEQACSAEKTPADRIRCMAAAYRKFSKADKNYFEVINAFLSAPDILLSEELKTRIDTHGHRILGHLRRSLDEGVLRGTFRSDLSAKKTAVAFWGMLHGLVQFRKLQDTIMAGGQFRHYFNYAVEHFIAGLRPQPEKEYDR